MANEEDAHTDFSHVIVAFTTRSVEEDSSISHNINLYKVIELEDGTVSVFDFKINAIQANFESVELFK